MDLCIFFSNYTHLKTFDHTFLKKYNNEKIKEMSKEENVYLNSLQIIKEIFGNNIKSKIRRLYFGNETCENLIPSTGSLRLVLDYCHKNKYKFVYVTPYSGPKGIAKLRTNLDFLNRVGKEIGKDIEILINDFGVLNLIDLQYKNLKGILGRLLMKTKRDPRFSRSFYPHLDVQATDSEAVSKNQMSYFSGDSIDYKEYADLLKSARIKRASIDITKEYKGNNSSVLVRDVFWPWTYITSGRACRIAAIGNPAKENRPTDSPCHYECKKFQYVLRTDMNINYTVQRGNAVWMDSTKLFLNILKNKFNRFIYEPFIPV